MILNGGNVKMFEVKWVWFFKITWLFLVMGLFYISFIVFRLVILGF